VNFRFSALGGLCLLLALPLAAQQKAPVKSASHPDLSGNWTPLTATPLERPANMAGKTVFSKEEAEAFEKATEAREHAQNATQGAEELIFEQGKALTVFPGGEIRTSLIIDPPDGKLPALTPENQAKLAALRKEAAARPAADGPEDRSLSEQCLYFGNPGAPMGAGGYNSNYQITQGADSVVIMAEMIHDTRVIPADGRAHLPSSVRLWLGDSVGHWEGDTLVIDTTNFSDKTRFRNSDENLHVIERLKRIDANSLLYRYTIDDPTAFTKPWTVEMILSKAPGVYEYACHEGNYALRDILAGASADEAAGKTPKAGGNLYSAPGGGRGGRGAAPPAE
jgi:hypothetical protein